MVNKCCIHWCNEFVSLLCCSTIQYMIGLFFRRASDCLQIITESIDNKVTSFFNLATLLLNAFCSSFLTLTYILRKTGILLSKYHFIHMLIRDDTTASWGIFKWNEQYLFDVNFQNSPLWAPGICDKRGMTLEFIFHFRFVAYPFCALSFSLEMDPSRN